METLIEHERRALDNKWTPLTVHTDYKRKKDGEMKMLSELVTKCYHGKREWMNQKKEEERWDRSRYLIIVVPNMENE